MATSYARLSLEEKKMISWKGKTFSQITADVRKNNNTVSTLTTRQMMNPQPLKIYRREIVSQPLKTCNRRTSIQLRDFEMPGATITHSKLTDASCNGLSHTIDMNLPNNTCEYPGSSCDSRFSSTTLENRCLSTENNALRRVRSSGMIPKKFNVNKNNDTYYTSTRQYLDSRNLTFEQNTYHMLRSGSENTLPGTAAAQQNVYASNTASHCSGTDPLHTAYVPVYYKPSNSKFAEQGSVTSSTRILRLKYDTITTAGSKLKTAFGQATANALAYSTTNSSLYSAKAQTGYPNKKTPVINKFTGNMQTCDKRGFAI